MVLTDSDKIRLVEDHYRSFWEGDLQDFDRQLSPGFVNTGADSGTYGGIERAKAWARRCREASPCTHVVVTDALVAGNVVAVRLTRKAPDAERLRDPPATGGPIELASIAVWELDQEGRLVRCTDFRDVQLLSPDGWMTRQKRIEGGKST